MPSQNVYENAVFFENYSALPRSVHGLDGAPEWPRLQEFLPDLAGARVLDLGCGFGWFCRWAADHGAEGVHGVDIPTNMLEKARSMSQDKHSGITYARANLDALELPESDSASYDLVFSSLAFHYLEHWPPLVRLIHRVLRPGGRLVFSVEHPIFTCPPARALMVDPGTGRKYWKLEDYQKEGIRSKPWFVDGVEKQHRTMATYINLLLDTGFKLANFDEWCPTVDQLRAHPEWETEFIRPMFLLIGAVKTLRLDEGIA
ncbi:S-adenosyl-L-methionine-dependent methyltransferase [Coniochaeta hoffmannii]|uniref:S-adenosyl-L-methionine-dependent methyltransferase n=1 Tax=Coniochaeta hoffmannii TaxID=91930 RepID=A0AA38VRW6_9PEZI|nr:S-adenosyl-L-methionine-dependent methyltransferase [Coniochaeta hoffmannii]